MAKTAPGTAPEIPAEFAELDANDGIRLAKPLGRMLTLKTLVF